MGTRLPKAFCTALLLAGIATSADAQTMPKDWPHDPKNCMHLLSNDYQCNWKPFVVKGTIEGQVLAYTEVNEKDKSIPHATVAIINTGKETVRILVLSNGSHKQGDRIKVTAAPEPKGDLWVPLDRDFYLNEEKRSVKPTCRANEFDNKIYKTAWGKIVGDPK